LTVETNSGHHHSKHLAIAKIARLGDGIFFRSRRMSLSHLPAIANGGLNDSPKLLSNGWPAAWIADDPDAEATSPEAVYQSALKYIDTGLSVIPIDSEEPTKSPCPRRLRSWKIYQVRLPRPDELLGWLECGGAFGLAVLGGTVSGGQKGCGLEIIDFDSFELATPWLEQVEARAPGLTNRLVMVQSPRP
jgi:hypothetical protein